MATWNASAAQLKALLVQARCGCAAVVAATTAGGLASAMG